MLNSNRVAEFQTAIPLQTLTLNEESRGAQVLELYNNSAKQIGSCEEADEWQE
jgi:hypothetical protein